MLQLPQGQLQHDLPGNAKTTDKGLYNCGMEWVNCLASRCKYCKLSSEMGVRLIQVFDMVLHIRSKQVLHNYHNSLSLCHVVLLVPQPWYTHCWIKYFQTNVLLFSFKVPHQRFGFMCTLYTSFSQQFVPFFTIQVWFLFKRKLVFITSGSIQVITFLKIV